MFCTLLDLKGLLAVHKKHKTMHSGGIRTWGGRMVGADESIELWRHPIGHYCLLCKVLSKTLVPSHMVVAIKINYLSCTTGKTLPIYLGTCYSMLYCWRKEIMVLEAKIIHNPDEWTRTRNLLTLIPCQLLASSSSNFLHFGEKLFASFSVSTAIWRIQLRLK